MGLVRHRISVGLEGVVESVINGGHYLGAGEFGE